MSDWYMRLTIVNTDGGQTAMAMYPDNIYNILETLDECQIPYGSGRYRHLSVSPNGVPADKLQASLASAIENGKYPPSIRELNYLGELIQKMTEQERNQLIKEIQTIPEASILDVYAAIEKVCMNLKMDYTEEYLAERPVLLRKGDPYILIQLIHDWEDPNDEKAGVWVGCPADGEQITEAAQSAGVESLDELYPNMMEGIFSTSGLLLTEAGNPFQSFREINQLATAMKDHNILPDIGKFKAVLYFEGCMDFTEAAELAGQLDKYEFFRRPELEDRLRISGYSSIDDALEKLAMEETSFGFIRGTDSPSC